MKTKVLDKCPKTYIKWAFVSAGMSAAFFVYLAFMNITGIDPESELVTTDTAIVQTLNTDTSGLVLVEHIEEEDDYEKPVCKRLEEESERYDTEDVYTGVI
jgi:hypothetical protein